MAPTLFIVNFLGPTPIYFYFSKNNNMVFLVDNFLIRFAKLDHLSGVGVHAQLQTPGSQVQT